MLTQHLNPTVPGLPTTPARTVTTADGGANLFSAALAATSSAAGAANPASPSPSDMPKAVSGTVILTAQQTDDTPVSTADESDDGTVPIGIRHYMEDIAADPTIAEKAASGRANGTPCVFVDLADLPKNGDPPEAWMAFSRQMGAKMDIVNRVQKDIKTLYLGELAKGTPPAQVYADILKLQLSQPQSYLDTQGPPSTIRDTLQGQLDYLQKVMAS